jgi:hypothetical protein
MEPKLAKVLMTAASGTFLALGAAPPWPWLVPFASLLTGLGGVLAGAAHVPQPGAKAQLVEAKNQAAVAKSALAAALEDEVTPRSVQ